VFDCSKTLSNLLSFVKFGTSLIFGDQKPDEESSEFIFL